MINVLDYEHVVYYLYHVYQHRDMYMYMSLVNILFSFICSFLPDTSVNPSIDFLNQFKIEPPRSSLSPGDKAKAVSITFLARREITLQNQPLLKCQVRTPCNYVYSYSVL